MYIQLVELRHFHRYSCIMDCIVQVIPIFAYFVQTQPILYWLVHCRYTYEQKKKIKTTSFLIGRRDVLIIQLISCNTCYRTKNRTQVTQPTQPRNVAFFHLEINFDSIVRYRMMCCRQMSIFYNALISIYISCNQLSYDICLYISLVSQNVKRIIWIFSLILCSCFVC